MFKDYKDSKKSSPRFKKNFIRYVLENYSRQEMTDYFRELSVGNVILFNYALKYPQRMKYFDVFPLIIVVGFWEEGFYGVNIHYMRKRIRTLFFKNLKKGKLIYPSYCFHKYLYGGCSNIFLKLKEEDYIKVASFPLESFFSYENGRFFSHKRETAWNYWESIKYKTYRIDVK